MKKLTWGQRLNLIGIVAFGLSVMALEIRVGFNLFSAGNPFAVVAWLMAASIPAFMVFILIRYKKRLKKQSKDSAKDDSAKG